MFKTLVVCSAVALASSQGLQALAEQANAVLAPLLNQENPVTVNGDTLSLVVNNYEWSLTEQGNEYEFGVDQLPENANNLAPALSALLAGATNAGQDGTTQAAADNVLNAEADSVGVALDNSSPAADAANQYGDQLAGSTEALNNLAQDQYNNAADALANNANGVTDQVNQQLNANAADPAGAVNAGADAAASNAAAANDLAAQNADAASDLAADNVGSPAPATAAVLDAASDPNTTDVATDLTNQAVSAGQDAANANLPQNLADSANDAAGAAGDAAAANLNNAADAAGNAAAGN